MSLASEVIVSSGLKGFKISSSTTIFYPLHLLFLLRLVSFLVNHSAIIQSTQYCGKLMKRAHNGCISQYMYLSKTNPIPNGFRSSPLNWCKYIHICITRFCKFIFSIMLFFNKIILIGPMYLESLHSKVHGNFVRLIYLKNYKFSIWKYHLQW